MPFYFAYGANMDVAAMARRCPASRAIGVARLPRHNLFITSDGWASVQRAPRDSVHGVLWDLALADVGALDRFEGVERGLYRKSIAPIAMGQGRFVRAMIYVARSMRPGVAPPGYIEAIVAAAGAWAMPAGYCATLAALAPKEAARGRPMFRN